MPRRVAGLPAPGLGEDVGQVQRPCQPRVARRRGTAQIEPYLAVVPAGHGVEQGQLRAAGSRSGDRWRRRPARAAFLAGGGAARRGAPFHPGEEQLVVADPSQPRGPDDRRAGIGRGGVALVPGLAPAQSAVTRRLSGSRRWQAAHSPAWLR